MKMESIVPPRNLFEDSVESGHKALRILMHSEGTALEENSKLEISDKKIERSNTMRKQSKKNVYSGSQIICDKVVNQKGNSPDQ